MAVATGDITITGRLNISGDSTDPGAGSGIACVGGSGDGNGGIGGGGGGFGSPGGTGGGGSAAGRAIWNENEISGGCPGGRGQSTPGGYGGGAVLLFAGEVQSLDGQDVAVLAVSSFDLLAGAELRATGELPLAIVSRGDIVVGGIINVDGSSDRAAGADIDCNAEAGIVSEAGFPGSGGGGGGFAGKGGDGAKLNGVPGGSGGALVSTSTIGGCSGAPGGGTSLSSVGGPGGGAILLFSGQTLDIKEGGIVSANGLGGKGGPLDVSADGGAGGGSGGLIRIEAGHINSIGVLVAKGGGGKWKRTRPGCRWPKWRGRRSY